VYEMAKRWVEKGARVQVITSPYYKSDIQADGFISRQNIAGIELIVVNSADSNKLPKWKRIIRALGFSIISTYYALIAKADIVIASSGPITVGIPGMAARWLTGKKLVFEVRDLWPRGAIEMNLITGRIPRWLGMQFERLCYRSSQLVVPCSIGMEADIKSRFPGIQTVVVPNGSDLELFGKDASLTNPPAWLEKAGQKVFVYFGSLGVMDACDEIITGLHAIPEKDDIHVVFIGDGSEREALEALVDRFGLGKQVHFLGLLPKKEVVAWLKIAKASFVVFKHYPVLATSSPNKMFDSFAAGLPIIQNTAGWMKALVDQHGCGLNVETGNPASMAAAINTISELDQEHWKGMANAARALAINTFNRDILADQYYDALNRLVVG
jgi:glycosyltransferase involved in cell wall biosynthesis